MNAENNLTIEEIEILITAMGDWLVAEGNQATLELMNQFAHIQTVEEINKLKDKIKVKKIKQKENLKEKKEQCILLQSKLIRKKKEILGSAFNNFDKN